MTERSWRDIPVTTFVGSLCACALMIATTVYLIQSLMHHAH